MVSMGTPPRLWITEPRRGEWLLFDRVRNLFETPTSVRGDAEAASAVARRTCEAWPFLSREEKIEGFNLLSQPEAQKFFKRLDAADQDAVGLSRAWRKPVYCPVGIASPAYSGSV